VKQVFKFTAFAIFFRNWWERISGQCVLKLREVLEQNLRMIPQPEPKKRIRVFHGLYPTVQALFISKGLRAFGVESRYETIADNFRYQDPDEYHAGVIHPDIGHEHVKFMEEMLLPHIPIFFDDHSLNRLIELIQRRWEKYDAFHFGWFLSFLPDNLDVEYFRRSDRSVYFHFRGCFILSLKLKDQLATNEMDIESACAYCKKIGWREQYFARFYRGINNANRIFVSTPNLCHCSDDFEYMPLILDPDMENLPMKDEKTRTFEPLTVVHAVGSPGHYAIKGSGHIMKAVETLQKEGLNVRFQLIENMTRQQATKIMREGDILVEQLNLGAYGNVALEGMAHGLPVISSLHSSVAHLVPGCPVINADSSNVVDRLRKLVTNPELRRDVGRRSYDFVREFHSSKVVTSHLLNIYKADFGLIPSKRTNTIARKHPSYE
jgi:glycosyltransferase involved in cell wall biosynthesis